MTEKLAKIKSASLEIKERGIINFWLHVDYEDGFSQGIGGIALDTYNNELDTRVDTAYGCEMIRQILLTLDVNDFSEMSGKYIKVYGIEKSFSFTVKGFKTLSFDTNKTVDFDTIYQQFNSTKE